MNSVLVKPLITERSMRDAAAGKFTFQVDRFANKSEIAKEIAAVFKVHPIKVATMILKGEKKRSLRSRNIAQEADIKKAIVTLKKGEKIALFDVTEGLSPKSS